MLNLIPSGTHCCFVGKDSMEWEASLACSGSQSQDLLILSPTPDPLGPITQYLACTIIVCNWGLKILIDLQNRNGNIVSVPRSINKRFAFLCTHICIKTHFYLFQNYQYSYADTCEKYPFPYPDTFWKVSISFTHQMDILLHAMLYFQHQTFFNISYIFRRTTPWTRLSDNWFLLYHC